MYGISGYSGLNGLSSGLGLIGGSAYNSGANMYSSYGALPFGSGMYTNSLMADASKESIQNNYDIYATQQSFSGKQQVEGMSYSQQSGVISSLIKAGREDDALLQYEKLVDDIKSAPQYAQYNDNEIRTLAQNFYQQSVGTSILTDINKNASSSFVQGLKMGVPIFGTFFGYTKSAEDMTAEITGTPVKPGAQTAKVAGAVISGGTLAAGAVIGGRAVLNSAKSGWLSKMLSHMPKSGKVGGAIAAAAALVGVTVGAVKALAPSK